MKFNFLASPDDIENKFGTIKKYRHSLYSFFSMMPKGGDLHHHYSGSLYTETYIDFIITENYFLNIQNLIVLRSLQDVKEGKNNYIRLGDLSTNELDEYRYKLLREWSIKDFTNIISNDEHFFNSFAKFDIASKGIDFTNGLKELKQRAYSQKVSYIESMFISCDVKSIKNSYAENLKKVNKELIDFNEYIRFLDSPISDETYKELKKIIDPVFINYLNDIEVSANNHNIKIEDALANYLNDENFTITFQNYVVRNQSPIDVFINLAVSFQSSNISSNINGVNIVSAENGINSLLFYNLHILFYKFFEEKYPDVRYCMHAGELVSGMVKPEYLGVHIKKALFLKNLRRVGHAVDIIYDNEFNKTIKEIQNRNVINKQLIDDESLCFDIDYLERSFELDTDYFVVEINLSSNEFILNVKDDLHPVELYYRNNIPIVICSDDEGILRTSLTEQFALLTYKYGFSYKDIKKICFDSIRYSHIKNIETKKKLFKKLLYDFQEFEDNIDDFISIYVDGKVNDDFIDNEVGKRYTKEHSSFNYSKFKGLTKFI